MARLNKNGWVSEQSIHLAVMEWVALYPSIFPYILHFPNESPRTPRYGRLLKKMGMRKGVSDLFIALPRHNYHGAWIEIKSEKGRVSPAQKVFLDQMKEVNYYGNITYGMDETIKIIKWYCDIK